MSTHNIRAIDWSSCQESNDMCLSHIRKDSVLFDNSLSLKLDHTKNVRNSSPFSSIICDEIKFYQKTCSFQKDYMCTDIEPSS